MPITKTCPRCGRTLKVSQRCPCSIAREHEHLLIRQHRYDMYHRSQEAAAFYRTKRWQRLRQRVMEKYNSIDIYEYKHNGHLIPATIVHHIVPIEDDMGMALDIDNLIPVSAMSHKIIHRAYETDKKAMQERLKDLISNSKD